MRYSPALLALVLTAAVSTAQAPADDLKAVIARLEAAQVLNTEVLSRLDARVAALEVAAPKSGTGTGEGTTPRSTGVKMVKLRGDTYTLHPDGHLEWCEECNGRPDPSGNGRPTTMVTPTAPPVGSQESLTYDQAYRKALREGKPLVVWVGGNFCPQCVEASESDFVHVFVSSFPGVTRERAAVVGVADEGIMVRAGDVTWWVTGDKEFGHLPSIRNVIRRWRERRLAAGESGAYQSRATTTSVQFTSMPVAAVQVRRTAARAGACSPGG